jgi:hypothetical protein
MKGCTGDQVFDLCLDAVDARRAAGFGAPALGLTAEPSPGVREPGGDVHWKVMADP